VALRRPAVENPVVQMRRTLFADQVNVLWQKIYSRHILVDRPALISLPEGEIHIDCLSGTAVHSKGGPISIEIALHLASWLRMAFEKNQVPENFVKSATLTIQNRPQLRHPSDELGFLDRWSASARIVTGEQTYTGGIDEFGDLRASFA